MTRTSEAPLLAVEHLTTVFRLANGVDAPAVDDVSFDVRAGETLGLVGESGSGKSVTALSIVGLTAPGRIARGRVLFDGHDLVGLDDRALGAIRGRRIGYIFQEPMVALDPVYTLGFQIAETLRVHGLARGRAARRRAEDLLALARMPDPKGSARAFPHQLSGGLRQRAMIALALAAEPALLIADEPTTALDVTVQAEVLDLLRDLRRDLGLSMLLITHDLGVIAETANRVAVMYAGRLVEQGLVADILHNPLHPYTRALLASVPDGRPDHRLWAAPGNVPPLGMTPPGCAFAPRCPQRFAPCGDRPDLFRVDDTRAVRCFLHAQAPA